MFGQYVTRSKTFSLKKKDLVIACYIPNLELEKLRKCHIVQPVNSSSSKTTIAYFREFPSMWMWACAVAVALFPGSLILDQKLRERGRVWPGNEATHLNSNGEPRGFCMLSGQMS